MLLIFDLDGTLFQAKRAALLAASRLLEEYGADAPDDNAILKSSGRGIDSHLRGLLPDGADLDAARTRYLELAREAIIKVGDLFPGAREMVTRLAGEGYELAICSDSPEEYIRLAIEHTGIAGAFAVVRSAEGYASKAELIKELIRPGVPAIVIGDTHGDVEAARENGVPSIAALYGYGNKSMLSPADCFAETPEEIVNCVHKISANFEHETNMC